MEKNTPFIKPGLIKGALWGIIIVIIFLLLRFLEPLIKPLFIAFFFWFLIRELKLLLMKIRIRGKKIHRILRNGFAFLLITGALIFQFEIIATNFRSIADNVPHYEAKIEILIEQLSNRINNPQTLSTIKNWIKGTDLASTVGKMANSITTIIGDSLIVLIYLIFMLLEEYVFLRKIEKLFPGKGEKYTRVMGVMERINSSIRKYFISKTIVSLALAISCYIIMLLFGLDYPALWAFLIFILNYIPYVGSFFATLLPSLLAIFQFGDFKYFFYVFGAIQIMQIIMANVVEPKLMGKSLNLSPLTVLFSLALWGYLWGVVGMILAIPIMAILAIIFAQFDDTKYIAILVSEKGDIGE